MSAAPTAASDRAAPVWAFAAGLAAATLALAWPGFLTWDAAYQWYQVRSGAWDNVHPVVMTLLWRATDAVLPGPGGYFALQVLGYWLGLAWLVCALRDRNGERLGWLLALGLFPPVFALLPHLWKDSGLLVAMIWALAALAQDLRRPSAALRAGALAAITLACAYRHNALPLALPWLWHLAGRRTEGGTGGRRLVTTVLLTIVVAAGSALPNRLPGVADRAVWPVTATWDLAALSIASGQVLLPPSIIDADLDVATLRRDFQPWVAVPIYASGKIRDSVGLQPMTPRQLADLRRAWFDAVRAHPGAYLAHRARLAGYLFGFDPSGLPDHLVVDYTITALADNPPLAAADHAVMRGWRAVVAALVDTPLFSFWPWALLLAGVAATAFDPRRSPPHPLLAPLLGSAVLLLLPLLVAAPGADLRFLLWPLFAAALAVMLARDPRIGRPDP